MDRLLTVSFETRESEIESAVAALEEAGVPALHTFLADKALTLVSAGFPFAGVNPTEQEWCEASRTVSAIFEAAGIEAEAVGQGMSSTGMWNRGPVPPGVEPHTSEPGGIGE
jgi:hypothetical protein